MKVEEYGGRFGAALAAAAFSVPDGSLLRRAAQEMHEMAVAYHSDGAAFLHAGDVVNALASFAYGSGWLDAGYVLGLIVCRNGDRPSPHEIGDTIPFALFDRLQWKTERYRGMLDAALSEVEYGPDRESALYGGAEHFIAVARSSFAAGVERLGGEDPIGALAWFSYGHAWLDAGVRTGLLRIRDRRDLFTV